MTLREQEPMQTQVLPVHPPQHPPQPPPASLHLGHLPHPPPAPPNTSRLPLLQPPRTSLPPLPSITSTSTTTTTATTTAITSKRGRPSKSFTLPPSFSRGSPARSARAQVQAAPPTVTSKKRSVTGRSKSPLSRSYTSAIQVEEDPAPDWTPRVTEEARFVCEPEHEVEEEDTDEEEDEDEEESTDSDSEHDPLRYPPISFGHPLTRMTRRSHNTDSPSGPLGIIPISSLASTSPSLAHPFMPISTTKTLTRGGGAEFLRGPEELGSGSGSGTMSLKSMSSSTTSSSAEALSLSDFSDASEGEADALKPPRRATRATAAVVGDGDGDGDEALMRMMEERCGFRKSFYDDDDDEEGSVDEEDEGSVDVAYESWYRRDFETILDELNGGFDEGRYVMVPPTTPTSKDSLMIKRFFLSSPSSSSHPQIHTHNNHNSFNTKPTHAHRHILHQPTSDTSNPSLNELAILLQLNHKDLREDPWNPAPHVVRAVERDEVLHPPEVEQAKEQEVRDRGEGEAVVYLFLEGLREYDCPRMRSVANYVDLFRQVLEGLTFLHEHGIALCDCANPGGVMVDIGFGGHHALHERQLQHSHSHSQSDPPQDPHEDKEAREGEEAEAEGELDGEDDPERFDRTKHPVKYYFVNFSKAVMVVPGEKSQEMLLRRDVVDCGVLFEGMLANIPEKVSTKLGSLVKAMRSGEFGAEDARKLFEAMCRSLEGGVFELAVLG